MGLETIALVAAGAGTALQVAGQIQQSKAASAAAGYNAKVAENNARIATENANFAMAEGNQAVEQSGSKTRALIGATLANQGASGVDVNRGSTVAVRESEALVGMEDAQTIRSNAVRQAYGYQTSSNAASDQAQLYRSEGESATKAGYISAAGTVLSNAGSMAEGYNNYLSKNDNTGGLTSDDNFLSKIHRSSDY
jgi:hypothetical protein